MDRATRGLAVAGLGLLLLVGTLAVGAATAPDIGVADEERRLTLVGSQGGGPGWHDYGSVYLLEGDEMTWREDSADSYFDVTLRPDGTVLAGFMHSGYEEGCEPYDAPCTKTGFRVIDPDAEGGEASDANRSSSERRSDGGPTVVEEYSFPVRTESNSEVHEVERLDSGEYLLADMDRERLIAVEDGEITWQWNASELYNPPEDPTRRDWLHMNDVDAINDTHYLVSVRNANQIVLVERGEGAVEIINEDDGGPDDTCLVRGEQLVPDEDGDVRCGDPDVLHHQHNPQWLDEGAVLVADSDNHRVVELHRNETTGEWEPAWTLTRAEGVDLNWPRDADRLRNGNTLVTDTLNQRVFEVTPNGSVVWSRETPRIPYEADRLPEGERVGADRYATDGTVNDPDDGVPVLSTGMVVLRSVLPSTPFWFDETHLALSVAGVLLMAAGGIDRWRA